jgi:hypothetical protein
VGTVAEGIIFTLTLLLVSTLAVMLAQPFFSIFLHGNTWSETYASHAVSINSVGAWIDQYWLPVSGMSSIINYFGQMNSFAHWERYWSEMGNDFGWLFTVWAVIAIGVCVLAYRAFKRYKAEHSGVLGINRWLNFAVTFLYAFLILGLMINLTGEMYWAVRILIGLALALAVFVLCRFLLTLNIRRTLEINYYRVFLSIPCAALIIIIICVSGGFGYNSRQPDITDIQSANVTYTGAPDFIPGDGQTFGNFFTAHPNDPYIFLRDYYNVRFESEADIKKIQSLHQSMIDAGNNLSAHPDWIKIQIHFRYGLKNGETVDRFYKYMPREMAPEFLQTLEGTDYIRESAARATELAAEAIQLSEIMDPQTDTEEPFAAITAADALMRGAMQFTGSDGLELLSALQKDINALPFAEKYYPPGAAKAVLAVPRYWYDPEGQLSPPVLGFGETFANFSDRVFFVQPDDGNTSYQMTVNSAVQLMNIEPSVNLPFLLGPSTNAQKFYITESYAHTLAFLREKGFDFTGGAADMSDITNVYAEKYSLNPQDETQALYFRAYKLMDPKNSVSVKEIPSERLAELMALARTHYYIFDGGYLLHIERNAEEGKGNKERVTLFIPEADAPDYIK